MGGAWTASDNGIGGGGLSVLGEPLGDTLFLGGALVDGELLSEPLGDPLLLGDARDGGKFLPQSEALLFVVPPLLPLSFAAALTLGEDPADAGKSAGVVLGADFGADSGADTDVGEQVGVVGGGEQDAVDKVLGQV